MMRNSEAGYGLGSIVLHWVIAALFFGQVGLGIAMSGLADDAPAKFGLYQWHKSFGLLILVLALLRLGWRLANSVPELPVGMANWEKRAARLAHGLLYAALILVPITGWALVSASPLEVPTLAFYLLLVPHLPVPVSAATEQALGALHGVLAMAAMAIALVHIAAALRHEFWLRDGLLKRMIQPIRRIPPV